MENIDKEDYRKGDGEVSAVSISGTKGTNGKSFNVLLSPEIKMLSNAIQKNKSTEDIIHLLSKLEYDRGYFSPDGISTQLFGKDLRWLKKEDTLNVEMSYYGNGKSGDKLHIAAPENMIDNSKKAAPLFKIFKTRTKDPIVFRYVKDGVLVITFWE
jgi:hypothetical protein